MLPTTPNMYDQFADHAIINTADDEDGPIELYTCNTCGSVVRALTIAEHLAWHESLGR